MTLLLIISIIGISLLATNIKGVKPSESPLISLSIAIILLYLFAILGLLNFGIYFVFAVGFLSYILTAVLKRKNIKDYFKSLLEPGYIAFIVFVVLLYFICRPIVTGAWDEYSHWALIIKNMLMTGSLPEPGGAVIFITYPPATSLFQYMFIGIAGWLEGMLYYAQAILIASCVSAMLTGSTVKRPLLLALSVVLPILAIVKFSVHNIFNIFPDYLMAVMAAAAFVMYYKSEYTKADMIKLLPIMFALSLVRANAVMFVVFAVFAMGAVLLAEKQLKKKILHIVLPLASAVLGIVSWQIYLKITGAQAIVGKGSPLFPVDFERLIAILDKFKSALFFTKLGTVYQPLYLASGAMAFAFMAAVLTVILNIMLKKHANIRKKVLYVNVSFFILFGIYSLSLILGYQYIFTKPEALSLASYSRYMGTFFIFWIISIFFVLAELSLKDEFDSKGKQEGGCCAVCGYSSCTRGAHASVNAQCDRRQKACEPL